MPWCLSQWLCALSVPEASRSFTPPRETVAATVAPARNGYRNRLVAFAASSEESSVAAALGGSAPVGAASRVALLGEAQDFAPGDHGPVRVHEHPRAVVRALPGRDVRDVQDDGRLVVRAAAERVGVPAGFFFFVFVFRRRLVKRASRRQAVTERRAGRSDDSVANGGVARTTRRTRARCLPGRAAGCSGATSGPSPGRRGR